MGSLQSRVVVCDMPKHHGGIRSRSDIDLIVIHCTAGAESAHATIKWMNSQSTPISYAYVIDRDGYIYRMCQPEIVAYHAGDSAWPDPKSYPPGNKSSVNHRSVGISFANRNDGEIIPMKAIESALWLCSVFMRENDIPVDMVRGHLEVSPGRKTDPVPETLSMDVFRHAMSDYLVVG